jgi:hypothetical protein
MMRFWDTAVVRGERGETTAMQVLLRRAGRLWGVFLLLLASSNGWAYRPFFSTDAAVTDPQEEEIELGYFTLDQAQGKQTFTLPSLVLSYGLRRDIEVLGEFAVARDPTGALNIVDPGLFARAILKEGVLQEEEGPSVAVEVGPLLPSTRPDERHVGFKAIGIVSGQVEPFTLHVNVGGGSDRTKARPSGIWGVIGELPIRPSLRLVGEVAGESTKGALPNNTVLLGVIWQPSASEVYLDTGLRRGLSRGAADWQFTAGVTFSFSLSSVLRGSSRSDEGRTSP